LLARGRFLGFIFGLGIVTSAGAVSPPPMAIEHVNVLPMNVQGQSLRDVTVIIQDGRIASITAASNKHVLKDMKRIDGSGKWLMPGLTDMHVHLDHDVVRRLQEKLGRSPEDPYLIPEDIFAPYIANGVLQVVDLQSMSELIGLRVEVESGRVLGPRIFLAAMIDGSPPVWPVGTTRVATTPEGGRQAVRDAAAEGYDLIKVYSRLDLKTFTAIVDEARKMKLRVAGHIPARGKGITDQFFQPGFDLVAHAEEFAQQTLPPDAQRIPEYIEMCNRHGAGLIATLNVDTKILEQARDLRSFKQRQELRFMSPRQYRVTLYDNPYVANAKSDPDFIHYIENIVSFNSKLVPAFVAAGIPVFAGTDSGIPGIVPGFSLHDELELLANNGLTTLQALEAATRLPSEWLGVLADRGTVEVGKRADLLLLDDNPIKDIRNTRRIAAVFIGGRYLPRKELDQRLKRLESRTLTMQGH
jgi:imidazolonepropionase-like amidohydrolase